MSDVVSYEVRDRVALVTIERPEVKNAMSLEVFDQLADRAAQAGADDEVGAVVVRGRGGVFSSGIDTSVFAGQSEDGISLEFIDRLQASFTAYEELDKPTIALIEGYCFGAGLQLALACHLRAVVSGATLSLKEVDWGLVPDLGGTYRLGRLVGIGQATELALTGRTVKADTALLSGIVELGFSDEDPVEHVLAYARALARGPHAVREVPRLVRENADRDRDAALRAEAEAQVRCIEHPDFAEAVTAKLEKRPPRFTG